MGRIDNNIIFKNKHDLMVKSKTDGLYILPWRLLHDGHDTVRQKTVVRVDADAGVPISHSRFSAGGRIISAKIYVDNAVIWNLWLLRATNNTALPFWVWDAEMKGFMRCRFIDDPNINPPSGAILGRYVYLKIFAEAQSIPIRQFITENTPERIVTEGDNSLIISFDEVLY